MKIDQAREPTGGARFTVTLGDYQMEPVPA